LEPASAKGGIVSAAFLIVRIIIGLGIAAHGAQKLFGWFGGYGIAGTGGFFENLGFRPGNLFALAAGLGETVGGLLTVLGLGGPIGPAIMIVVMLVAIGSVHLGKGFFSDKGGAELPLMYIAGAMAVAFAGHAHYTLDNALGIRVLTNPVHIWYTMAAAIVLAALNLLARRRPQPSQT
jgi:putative oxidoreductase